MSVGNLPSWALCGLIARFLVSGRQSMSLFLTMVLGIVGALEGGFLYSLIAGTPSEPFSFSEHAWHGWVVAIIGGVLVLWAYATAYPPIANCAANESFFWPPPLKGRGEYVSQYLRSWH